MSGEAQAEIVVHLEKHSSGRCMYLIALTLTKLTLLLNEEAVGFLVSALVSKLCALSPHNTADEPESLEILGVPMSKRCAKLMYNQKNCYAAHLNLPHNRHPTI